ncbi:MAG: hypothetical protein Q9200_007003, partial [Gallowayella weberi]
MNAWNPVNRNNDNKDKAEAYPNAVNISNDDRDRTEAPPSAIIISDDDEYRAEASPNAIGSSKPIQLPSFVSLGLPDVKRIPNAKIYQMASIVIEMSGHRAGNSDGDAMAMWDMWWSQAPDHFSTKVRPPEPGARVMDRGIAIIRLGQEVYEAAFPHAGDAPLQDQLKFVAVYRELAIYLEGGTGKKRIDDILIAEVGSAVLPLLPERPVRRFFGAP